MRVRTTILLLLFLAGTAFVAGLCEVHRSEEKKFTRILEERNKDWEDSTKGVLKTQLALLERMVNQYYSVEDEMSPGEGTLAMLLNKVAESLDVCRSILDLSS